MLPIPKTTSWHNVFHLSVAFLFMFYVLSGMQQVPAYIFGSLFINVCSSIVVNSLFSPFSLVCVWFNVELGNNVSRSDESFPSRSNVECIRLLTFYLSTVYNFSPKGNTHKKSKARTDVFMNFMLNNWEYRRVECGLKIDSNDYLAWKHYTPIISFRIDGKKVREQSLIH